MKEKNFTFCFPTRFFNFFSQKQFSVFPRFFLFFPWENSPSVFPRFFHIFFLSKIKVCFPEVFYFFLRKTKFCFLEVVFIFFLGKTKTSVFPRFSYGRAVHYPCTRCLGVHAKTTMDNGLKKNLGKTEISFLRKKDKKPSRKQ